MQGPCPILWDVRRNASNATVTPATGVNPELNRELTYLLSNTLNSSQYDSMCLLYKQSPFHIRLFEVWSLYANTYLGRSPLRSTPQSDAKM